MVEKKIVVCGSDFIIHILSAGSAVAVAPRREWIMRRQENTVIRLCASKTRTSAAAGAAAALSLAMIKLEYDDGHTIDFRRWQ
ncbi:hypothetical protein JOB18_049193 [Solea senegalensis]|uniref:Uncharacterized protein n=1 Tax=Solea senegalensis TaxID=28829 RepID=A0AAV6SAT1_SOLSE|nr:hypothetical protein JOB18_049193 [Solea senegalensis]